MARTKSIYPEADKTIRPYADTYTYNHTVQRYEKTRGPSATVPDQNYTMREILNRFTSGRPIDNMGVYNEYDFSENRDLTREEFEQAVDEYLPHPRTMDLYDRQIYREKLLNEQKNLKENEKRHKFPQKNTDKQQEPSQGNIPTV